MSTSDRDHGAPKLYWVVYGVLLLVVLVSGGLLANHALAFDNAALLASSAEAAVAEAEDHLAEVRQSIADESRQLLDVQSKLDPLQAEYKSLTAETVRQHTALGRATEQQSAAETRRDEAQADYKTLQLGLTNARSALKDLEQQTATARSNAQQATEDRQVIISALEDDMAMFSAAETRLTKLTQDLHKDQQEHRVLQRNILDLTREQTALQRELDAAKAVIAQSRLLETSVASLQRQQSDVRDALAEKQIQLDSADRNANRLASSLQSQEARLAEITARGGTGEQELATLKNDIADRTSSVATLTREQSRLESAVENLRISRDRSETDSAQANRELKQVQLDLQDEQRRRTSVRLELAGLNEQRTQAEDDVQTYTARRDALQKEVVGMQAQKDQRRADQVLTRELSELSTSVQNLINRLTALADQATAQLEKANDPTEGGDE